MGLDPLIFGDHMPKDAVPLSLQELRTVARWIDEGAVDLPGGPPDDLTPEVPAGDGGADARGADAGEGDQG
jgi:hypothetical protein